MSKKVKNIKLNISQELKFSIIGILTSEKDYKLAWLLNQNLDCNFVKTDNIELTDKNKLIQSYTTYHFLHENETEFKLIQNKNNISCFLEDLRNIDFFLVIYDENQDMAKELRAKISMIQGIDGVFLLDTKNIKSKNILMLQK